MTLAVIGSPTLGGAPFWNASAAADIVLATGVAANKADLVYAATLTIAASGNQTLNLANGSLLNPIGEAVTFVKIKTISIVALAANTNDVVIGAAGSNPFVGPFGGTAPTIAVKPGGRVLLCNTIDGWTVGSGVNLKLANSSSGSGVTFDIEIVGTSA